MSLPAISTARLPASYERAKTALAECSSIDECQDWADKAEALASYAKQAKDDQLRKMADRIQARAIRRASELLRQFPENNGKRHDYSSLEGTREPASRRQAAHKSEMSDWQYRTAMNVGNVSRDEFERQVESDNPPTVTALANQGKKSLVDLGNTDPSLYAQATQVGGQLRRMADMCRKTDPRQIAGGFKPHEITALRDNVRAIDGWLDLFVTNLGN